MRERERERERDEINTQPYHNLKAIKNKVISERKKIQLKTILGQNLPNIKVKKTYNNKNPNYL